MTAWEASLELELRRKWEARMIDEKGRCCGRKPLSYKAHLFCPRCNRAYDVDDRTQVENWAFKLNAAGEFVSQLSGRDPVTAQTENSPHVTDGETCYISAVRGRRDFRAAYKRVLDENAALVAALKSADEAINPADRGGISLETWNNRLKAATQTIRAAITGAGRA